MLHTNLRSARESLAFAAPHAESGDGAGEAAVADHPGDVQVLDDDGVVLGDEPGGELVRVIARSHEQSTTLVREQDSNLINAQNRA
ncbi:MAG: hypothetical protein ACRDQY_18950 [Pseudonocardiaceae bacterium]